MWQKLIGGKILNSSNGILGTAKRVVLDHYTWLLLLVLYLGAGILVPTLFTSMSLVNILVQGTTVCLLAFGMTFAMLVGKIDVSIVAIASGAPMAGIIMWEHGVPVIFALLAVLAIGLIIGFINGVMIAKLKIPALVQTVAMWWMVSGTVLLVTKGQAKTGLPDSWMFLGKTYVGPLPLLIFFFILIVIVTQIFARRTVTGRRIYLVGGNPEASGAMGISVDRMNIIAYMISGLFAALAGYFLSARMGFVSAQFAEEWLMPAIAAPVIAGVGLQGGKGNFINVIAGAYLVQLIVLVVRAGGVGGYATEFVQGVLVFAAILINTVRERLSSSRLRS